MSAQFCATVLLLVWFRLVSQTRLPWLHVAGLRFGVFCAQDHNAGLSSACCLCESPVSFLRLGPVRATPLPCLAGSPSDASALKLQLMPLNSPAKVGKHFPFGCVLH